MIILQIEFSICKCGILQNMIICRIRFQLVKMWSNTADDHRLVQINAGD